MKKPLKHHEVTDDGPDVVPDAAPATNRRTRREPKLFIHYLPDGKGQPGEEKGSVPLEVDVEAHIEERSDCEPGIYRIEKKRGGAFSGDVMFYTKEPLTRVRSVGPSVESGDGDDDPSLELEPESPGDRLLRSLQGKVDGGRVVVIAKRKADPVGMSFRFPCSTDCTIGEVPYDEADPSIEALELSIQKLYGGGKYEIVVRQAGETVGSVERTLADPLESRRGREDGPPVREVPSPPAVPTKSPVDELKASVSVFKEVAAAINNMRPAEPERETPIETLKNAIGLVRDLNTYLPRDSGGVESEGSSVREWMDGIASIGREFGLGTAINNLLMFGLQGAAMKRAAEASAKTTAAPGGSDDAGLQEQSTTPPTSSSVSMPLQPATPPPDSLGQSADARASVSSAGLSLEMLPLPMRFALEKTLGVVVSEMQRSESCDDHETEVAGQAIQELVATFPPAFLVLDHFMQQSSARVLVVLASLKPEWASVIDLKGASGFIEVLQDEWTEAKESANSESLLSDATERNNGLQSDRAN